MALRYFYVSVAGLTLAIFIYGLTTKAFLGTGVFFAFVALGEVFTEWRKR